jgi:hypothetical protein
LIQRAEKIEQRALSRTARTHDGHGLAFLHFQTAIDQNRLITGAIGLCDVTQFRKHGREHRLE